MAALYVIGGILLLILLILLTNAKVRITVSDTFTLKAGAGPIMYTITPKKEKKKKVRLSSYRYGRFRRKREKELLKKKKAEAKKLEKKAEKEAEGEKTPMTLSSVIDLIRFGLNELGILSRNLKTEIVRFRIDAGSEDPALTAQLYGTFSALTETLFTILRETSTLKEPKDGAIVLTAGFTSLKTTVNMDIIMRIRVVHLLRIGWHAFKKFILSKSGKDKNKKPDDGGEPVASPYKSGNEY